MKRDCGLLAGLVLAATLTAEAAVATLPSHRKEAMYFGWDTLDATTDDVYRNRDKFAATGFDGIGLNVTGFGPDGRAFNGRRVISGRRWTEADFAKSLAQIRELTKLEGLKSSYALVYWQSRPRLRWDDDAAWERFASNMSVLCRVAKAGGLKGCFIDHEDYTGKPLFRWRRGEDPAYGETLRLARLRGRQIFRAMYEAFPEGRMINDRSLLQLEHQVYSQNIGAAVRNAGDLWYAFMNGGLDALPVGSTFCDGNEASYGEVTADDYRARYFACCREGLELVEPALRGKYLSSLEMCFAKYLNPYAKPGASSAKFAEALFGAGRLTDRMYWVYGERTCLIDWGRALSKRTTNEVWRAKLPDLATLLRVSVGDYAPLRAAAARGELENLVSNPHCDAQAGQTTPAPFRGYSEGKDSSLPRFAYDAADGCSRPGCITLVGPGSYTFGRDGLVRSGDRFYFTMAAKGTVTVNVVWRSASRPAKWNWWIGYQILAEPCETLADGWGRYEVCLIAPEGVDGIGFVAGGYATGESPVKFDDISIYRW